MKNKTTKNGIDEFLSSNTIAIAGVSRNPKKFGYMVYSELKQKGFNVLPMNPKVDSIDGDKCYSDIKALPLSPEALIILTPKKETDMIVQQSIEQGIRNIWIQQGSETKQTMDMISSAAGNFITGECIFMFVEPVKGIHSFHRFVNKLFGAYPR